MEPSLNQIREEIISSLRSIANNPQNFLANQSFLDIALNSYNKSLKMKISGIPEDKKQFIERVEYDITPSGLLGSPRYRGDGIVVFGKAGCDVNFPQEETKIDPISCIIFSVRDGFRLSERPYYYVDPIEFGRNQRSVSGYYYIDCSRSGNTGVKLFPGNKILLKKGMMIKFASSIIVEISDISSFETGDVMAANHSNASMSNPIGNYQPTFTGWDEEKTNQEQARGTTNFTISFKNHAGPFRGETFKFQSHPRPDIFKERIIIGCGGNGVEPDFFCPRDTGISRHHATAILEDGSWYLVDNNSVNLTIILAKTSEQYLNKEPSFPQPLFLPQCSTQFINEDKISVLAIENYKFYFTV